MSYGVYLVTEKESRVKRDSFVFILRFFIFSMLSLLRNFDVFDTISFHELLKFTACETCLIVTDDSFRYIMCSKGFP